MRQTGRSSRIADFAVDQLYSIGEVIVTDHTTFEYPNTNTKDSLSHLCDIVKRRFDMSNRQRKWNLSFEFHKVKGFNVVYIKRVERKEELHEKEDLN
jgi:hypothetical protein